MKKVRRSRQDRQESHCFRYYEELRSILRDLETIDGLIPAEVSRISLGQQRDESTAIIVGRKDDVLRYIQTICRDHLHYGKKLLNDGWIVK